MLTLGQNYTAWADRKRLLLRSRERDCGGGAWRAALVRELSFTALVLRSFTKSHEAFAHRRWVLAECMREKSGLGGPAWFLGEPLCAEVTLCAEAMAKRKANYHAARHLKSLL